MAQKVVEEHERAVNAAKVCIALASIEAATPILMNVKLLKIHVCVCLIDYTSTYMQVGAQQLKLEQQQRRAQVVLTGLRTLLTIGVGYGSFMLLNRLKKPEEENSGNIISNNTNGGLTHNQHSSNTSI